MDHKPVMQSQRRSDPFAVLFNREWSDRQYSENSAKNVKVNPES